MIAYGLLILLLFCTGCQGIKTFAPTIGGGIGAGLGSLGGVPGSIAGGTLGAGAGQIYKEVSQNEKAQKTLEALSHGDVQALVSAQMSDHASGFDEFKNTILNILKIAVPLSSLIFLDSLSIPSCNCVGSNLVFKPTKPSSPSNKGCVS